MKIATIQFKDKSFLSKCLSKLDQKEPFMISINGFWLKILRKTLPKYDEIFIIHENLKQNPIKNRIKFLFKSLVTFFPVSLWSVIILVEGKGMTFDYYDTGEEIKINIKPVDS